ncbi:MAG TPA: UvrD-helicase domain-containing protein [Candidatus Oscillibacter pullicola]|nr:UvrD-helicase domain-containing protein [Candidatus Oscillibacter pullicola]
MNAREKALRAALTGEGGTESFKKNWIVEAGAGAGKTYTIVQRIVQQLTTGYCAPEHMVAITFTNKATDELRDRVTRQLRKLRDQCQDAAERRRLDGLYHGVGKMHLSTIHSFCQTMLMEMPMQAGLDLEPRLLDEDETTAYYQKLFRRAYQANAELFASLEHRGIQAEILEKPFGVAIRHPEYEIPYDKKGSPAYQQAERMFISRSEELRSRLQQGFGAPVLEPYCDDWLRDALHIREIRTADDAQAFLLRVDGLIRLLFQKDGLRVKSTRLKDTGKPDQTEYPLPGLVREDGANTAALLALWEQYREDWKELRNKEKRREEKKQKKEELERGGKSTARVDKSLLTLQEEIDGLQDRLDNARAQPAWKMVSAALELVLELGGKKPKNPLTEVSAPIQYTMLMELLTQCLQWARADKAEHNLLTFDDLLLRARDLLRDCPEARERFHQRYRVIYVDEFQDTDPVQAQLLFYLTATEASFSTDWTQCRPAAGSLFLVGDPKQSIYRFRGADLSIYQKVRDIFAEESAAHPDAFAIAQLQTNFRSTAAICHKVTELFATKLDGQNGQAAFLAMEAEQTALDHADSMYGWNTSAEQCPQQIAAFISQAVKDKKAKPEDFLVLTYRREEADSIYGCLRQTGIPAQVTGKAKFRMQEPIRRLALWCRLLLEPGNDIARMHVLQQCLGVRPAGLFALGQQTGLSLPELFSRRPEELEELSFALPSARHQMTVQALQTVQRALKLPIKLPPMAILDELAHGSYGVWPAGQPDVEGYGLVCQYLESLRSNRCQTLQTLLQKAKEIADKKTVDRQLTLQETGSCVRVMNLHKAKGLEGNIVILASTDWKEKEPKTVVYGNELCFSIRHKCYDEQGSGWTLLARPRIWENALEEEARQAQQERLRLLYVAATRPAQALLVGHHAPKKKKDGDGDGQEKDYWADLKLPLVTVDNRVADCDAAPLLESPSPSAAVEDSPVRLADAAWDQAQKQQAAQLQPPAWQAITPSGLNHPAPPARMMEEETALVESNRDEAGVSDDAAAGGADGSPCGADWGTMMHRTLELMVRCQAWDEHARARFARQAVEETLSPNVPLTALQREQLFRQQVPASYPEQVAYLSAAATTASGFLADPDGMLRGCLDQGKAWTELPFFLRVDDPEDPLYGHLMMYRKGKGDGSQGVQQAALDVQGIIDLAIQTPRGWIVVDYKTDRLRQEEAEAAYSQRLCAEYTPQIQSYVLVLERLGLGKVSQAWLCSIPLGGKLIRLALPDEKALDKAHGSCEQ